MPEPITKEDLINFRDDIKGHISDKLKPIEEKVNGHNATLYGKEGRNGVVGDLNQMKGSGKVMKWFAGIGGLSGLWATIKAHIPF
jgi:hypothetical protein